MNASVVSNQWTPIWERARGRWYGILTGLGVDGRYLTGKPGPCPICGGKDRFTFDDKNGDGTYICRHCGAGIGAQFVQKFCNVDFKGAAQLIEAQLPDAIVRPIPRTQSVQQNFAEMNKLWNASLPVEAGDPVHQYLTSRLGDIDVPADIRYLKECRYGGEVNASFPAIIAMVRDRNGKPCQLHRTYLTADGQKAPVENVRCLMRGQHPRGSAVRLADASETLGVAEGIETALAAQKLFGSPVWATLTAARLEAWEPPDGVQSVVIFADNDASFTGQKAAVGLAHRLAPNISVEIKCPNNLGNDWNDELLQQPISSVDRVGVVQ